LACASTTQPTYSEAALLVTISFGWFILSSTLAVLSGFPTDGAFTDATLISLIMTEVVLGAAALSFLRYRGYRLTELLPSPTWPGVLEGVVVCGVGLAACMLVGALLPSAPDTAQPVARMLANATPSIGVVLVLSLLNGLYEETFLLGYLVRGFASYGVSFAIGLSVLVRVLYHLYQGPAGAVSVVVFGIVLGIAYWRTRRLWPAVVAHALADFIALA